ncbi:MAG: phosphoribosylformylglycinamidine synthase I [Deltaproteobacteria bacterium RBG_16_71_12]|nr:MAG: phosphoribosylformylglycinamidine synthase I [Deltaproteobacteria bacterium RBG_16_71_12]
MTTAVVTFPGSNCDRDCVHAVRDALGAPVVRSWHKDHELPSSTTSVMLPGGFSYGDYLRCGAMAALSPIMAAVKRFADAGGPVLGICNGFQILCEARLLPGALLRNHDGLFHCQDVELEVSAGGVGLLAPFDRRQRIALPIAHGEGNYTADEATLDRLEAEGRVAFRYLARDAAGNGLVNGARRAIAGVLGGPANNVVGLMPHPERRSGAHLHGTDGLLLLRGLVAAGAGFAEAHA